MVRPPRPPRLGSSGQRNLDGVGRRRFLRCVEEGGEGPVDVDRPVLGGSDDETPLLGDQICEHFVDVSFSISDVDEPSRRLYPVARSLDPSRPPQRFPCSVPLGAPRPFSVSADDELRPERAQRQTIDVRRYRERHMRHETLLVVDDPPQPGPFRLAGEGAEGRVVHRIDVSGLASTRGAPPHVGLDEGLETDVGTGPPAWPGPPWLPAGSHPVDQPAAPPPPAPGDLAADRPTRFPRIPPQPAPCAVTEVRSFRR